MVIPVEFFLSWLVGLSYGISLEAFHCSRYLITDEPYAVVRQGTDCKFSLCKIQAVFSPAGCVYQCSPALH